MAQKVLGGGRRMKYKIGDVVNTGTPLNKLTFI